MLSDEYVAGFFDGEGCVSISSQGRCNINVTQKNPEILEMIRNKYGGQVYSRGGRACSCYNWKGVDKKTIMRLLEAIYPYSIVKKKEIELGIRCAKLVRDVNNGCNPLSNEEYQERMQIRQEMQTLRPNSNFKNLTSQESRYRAFVKESANYLCNSCGKDLKETPIHDQVISQDKLWCRACAASRTNKKPLKPLSKERIEEVLSTCNSLDEACTILDIGRSALFKKRKQYGLSPRIAMRGKKRGTYIAESSV